ncbi:hypothetical protein ACA910_008682 [Epithemia clementina (nom. ined.)]
MENAKNDKQPSSETQPNENNVSSINNCQDILSYMMQKDAETGERLSFHALFANMHMVLFAGHDTAAATVAWALWEMAQNPDVQDKLYSEIINAVKEQAQPLSASSTTTPASSTVPYKVIAGLPYLDAVV